MTFIRGWFPTKSQVVANNRRDNTKTKKLSLQFDSDSDRRHILPVNTKHSEQSTEDNARSLFNFYSRMVGYKTREREKQRESCFTVRVLSFARKTKDKLLCSLNFLGPVQKESLKRKKVWNHICFVPVGLRITCFTFTFLALVVE